MDDDYLEVLKDELIKVQQLAIDQDGEMLAWTGEIGSSGPDTRRGTEDERHFQLLLPAVILLLQGQRRITYRTLKWTFGVDDALLDEIREELSFRQVARDELAEGLVWTGEPQPMTPPVVDVPSQSATTAVASVSTPLPVSETSTPPNGPTARAEAISTDVPQDDSIIPPESTRTNPEAERRQLTVMFCDLADSTKLSQQLDPEDLREVIRAYQQTSSEVIQRFDGYIAQHLGDGLLIYFGWPRAHEDDAQRALHAGLGIVEAVTTNLNPRLEAEKGVQLTVRLGVHTGPVVVGEMGGAGRQENLATGETVNIAARLEGLAKPNTVVVSSVTERLVRSAFALEDLGSQVLKGVTEPMAVFRVLGPTEMHHDEDDSMPDGGVFLVGRDEEVGLLLRRWEQSKEGLGQVVFLSGEAGIGKSSLVATVRSQVLEEGHTRITFRCSPYHTNSALFPVITHLEQVLNFDRDDTPDTKLDKLEQALKTTSLPLEESVPLLATFLSVPLEDRYTPPTSSPQQQRQQMLDTLVAWLMEESEKQPVLAIWEDLHWADPSTLEMLGLMVDQSPTAAILNLLTFRPEFSPPWSARSHITPITLNRLERPQVEALITHMTDDKPLPAEVVEHVVTKTDGVPLYVEELTKMLLASELLKEETDQYVLTGPLSTLAIPDTLQDSLMARLDQLNQAKEVAQLGAVLGREFSYDMLQAVWSQDEDILQAGLTQLVEAELLYQRGRPPRARYIFKHALIQDVAYSSLLRSTRQQVHQQIAQVLEHQFPETAETQPEWLAYHYTESGLIEQAVDYWQRAGEKAIQRSANVEAIRHFQQGLELLTTLSVTHERHRQELGLQLALGRSLMATKGMGAVDAERAYRRVWELCQHVEASAQQIAALAGLRRMASGRGDTKAARDLSEQLLELAQRQHDTNLLLEAHYSLGVALQHLGEIATARTQFEQGISLDKHQMLDTQRTLQRVGIDPSIGNRTHVGRMLWMMGYPEQAMQRDREALTLAEHRSHPYSQGFALNWSAILYMYRREGPISERQAEAGIALATTHAFEGWLNWATILYGWARGIQGHHEEGLATIQQGLSSFQSSGQASYRAYYLYLLAEIYGLAGQPEEGLRVISEALTTMETAGDQHCKAELYRLQGELLQRVESSEQRAELTPEACFQQALDIARNQQTKSFELRAATSLARLWQSQDKRQDAYNILAPVYGWFTEGFDTADLQDAKALLDELA